MRTCPRSFRPEVTPSVPGHGYQFAPNLIRVVVVLLGVPQSCRSPSTFTFPIFPTPRLRPPSRASLGERKTCTPPLAPIENPESDRSELAPVSKLSTVVLRLRRPIHAPTYGIALLRAIGKLRRAPASRWVRPKSPPRPGTSIACFATSAPA